MCSSSADSAHPRDPASLIVLHWLTFTLVVCVYALAELKGNGARQPPAQRDATPALSDRVVDIRVDVVAVHFAAKQTGKRQLWRAFPAIFSL